MLMFQWRGDRQTNFKNLMSNSSARLPKVDFPQLSGNYLPQGFRKHIFRKLSENYLPQASGNRFPQTFEKFSIIIIILANL